MSPIDPIRLAGTKAKGKRPRFLDDPAAERNMAIVMAVAQELAVMRERLDTLERLIEAEGVVRRAQIEAYRPDAAAERERMAWQAAYVARILRYVQQEREAIETAFAEADTETLARDFAQD